MFEQLKEWYIKATHSHSKGFGQPYPEHLNKTYEFCEGTYTGPWKYGIIQCSICGHRMFSCLLCHNMYDSQAQMVDKYIAYKLTDQEFEKFMDDNKFWWKKV